MIFAPIPSRFDFVPINRNATQWLLSRTLLTSKLGVWFMLLTTAKLPVVPQIADGQAAR